MKNITLIKLIFFCLILFSSQTIHSQTISNKTIKSNSVEIKGDIENLLINKKWKLTHEAYQKGKKVKGISKFEGERVFEIIDSSGILKYIASGINRKGRKYNQPWGFEFYPNSGVILKKASIVQDYVYKIVKLNENYLILQKFSAGYFDKSSGKILSKSEVNEKFKKMNSYKPKPGELVLKVKRKRWPKQKYERLVYQIIK